MQDEEGYTVLNLRPKMRAARRSTVNGTQGSPATLRGYKITVAILGAWSIMATLAVIALSLLGSSRTGRTGAVSNATASWEAQQEGQECGACLHRLVSHLSQVLCVPSSGSSLEGTSCKLCPSDWLPHRGKCYWFSTESKMWHRSREDCSAKGSRLVVIQEPEEMEFIRNSVQEKYRVWMGLTANGPRKMWTWQDGSSLNETLFPVKGSAEESSCGVIKGRQIQSETCSGEYRWICQKDAILIDSGVTHL
ncbi:killer cell lectin-like receptor subfamily F member 1 [Carettochelys insculpta]|uniref:killer cell lectin-like receptor subfamily F member 1 n=1 Tax=Carettochelys insculpta TaxID=44489 RepID=UPI003EC076FE